MIFLPEDGDRAQVPASLTLERDRRHLDPPGNAVEASNAQRAIRRPVFLERDHQGVRVRREGRPVQGRRMKDGGPLLERHLAGLFVSPAEKRLGRFVVKEHVARGVDQEDRRREVTRELSHEDDLDGFLRHDGLRPVQAFRDFSACRNRRESVVMILWASSGTSLSRGQKCRPLITSSRSGVSATTVAERGWPSSRLISPKNSPGPRRARFRGDTSTRAEPSRMKKNSRPGSPARMSTLSAGASNTPVIRATARSCRREQPSKIGTSCRRSIFSSWPTRGPADG